MVPVALSLYQQKRRVFRVIKRRENAAALVPKHTFLEYRKHLTACCLGVARRNPGRVSCFVIPGELSGFAFGPAHHDSPIIPVEVCAGTTG